LELLEEKLRLRGLTNQLLYLLSYASQNQTGTGYNRPV